MKFLHKTKQAVWLLVLFTLAACEDDVKNLGDLDLSPKLVVNSYISPQDTELKVQLQTTQPGIGMIRSEDQLRVKNATVTMSDGTTTVALAYDYVKDAYLADAADLPVLPGKTYFLQVSTPGGFKAEAYCVVPAANGITLSELSHKTVAADWDPQWKEHQFSYRWNISPAGTNYYRMLAYMIVKEPDPGGKIQTYTNPMYLHQDNSKAFISDREAFNGTIQSPTFYTNMSERGGYGNSEYELHALLFVADKNYYQYHLSVANQSAIGDNPFAEPVFIFSNIKGGLGVFGAYNEIEASITVR